MDLPYHEDVSAGTILQTKFEVTGGILQNFSQNGLIFSAGPGLELNIIRGVSLIDAGISPTFITRHSFTTNELGGLFNFTSYAGIYFSPFKFSSSRVQVSAYVECRDIPGEPRCKSAYNRSTGEEFINA